MKKIFNYVALVVLFASNISSSNAQIIARSKCLWVSSKGYWVIETNIHAKKNSTVRYYTNDHVLVHTEYVQNKKMNLKDREVKIRLKEDLEAALNQWENMQESAYIKETISSGLQ
ncbi:MAG: hypothetical protein ABI761_14055 [Saprospiraceae bacterium]